MHTPLPWKDGGCVVWQADGDMICDMSPLCVPPTSCRTPDEIMANTALIVKAVNNHEPMLKALKAFLDAHHNASCSTEPLIEAAKQARSVLKQMGEPYLSIQEAEAFNPEPSKPPYRKPEPF